MLRGIAPRLLMTMMLGCAWLATACSDNRSRIESTESTESTAHVTAGTHSWNFVRVGQAMLSDGTPDLMAFSKLAPWPGTDGDFLYSGCYVQAPLADSQVGMDRCFVSMDLSEPERPQRAATVFAYDLENSPAPPAGHVIWSAGYPYPNLPPATPCRVDWDDPRIADASLPPECWDPGWNTQTHFVAAIPGHLLAVNQERFRYGTERQANNHGVQFYDISNPGAPRYLSTWRAPASEPDAATGIYPDSRGAHHFTFHGDYLFVGTEYEGFIGKILVILDISDPQVPREAGRWWLPGQKTPEEDTQRDWTQRSLFSRPVTRLDDGSWSRHVGMHYVTVHDNTAYLSYHQSGLIMLDVSDVSAPRMLSRVDYVTPGNEPSNPNIAACEAAAGARPAACGNTHTAKRVPGRDLLMVEDEYFTCPFGHVRIFDISDETQPELLSHFLREETLDCDPAAPMRTAQAARFPMRGPSAHIGNAWNSDTYLIAWYGLGLQAIDISDPRNPRSAGFYRYEISDELPEADPRFAGADAYDVIIGQHGHLYLSDGHGGLRVLRYTGSPRQ